MEGQGEIALARSDDSSTKEMINDLEKREDVLFAEPNYQLHLASADLTGQQYSADMKNGLGIEGWNRKNAKGEPLPKVSTKGKVVAVMDSGIDYGHEDLKNVMWADGLKYKALNRDPDASPEVIDRNVHEALDEFVKDAPQFDDTTMLCLKYFG